MRVARILVANEGRFEMTRGRFVFSASIKGRPECDMGRSKTGITSECFSVCVASVALFALLIKREAFDVTLFRTLSILRIRDRPGGWFEIGLLSTGESV